MIKKRVTTQELKDIAGLIYLKMEGAQKATEQDERSRLVSEAVAILDRFYLRGVADGRHALTVPHGQNAG